MFSNCKCYSFLIFFLILKSCSKDNELKDVFVGGNPYNEPSIPYISVIKSEQINCNIVAIDIRINDQNIPDTLNYTHVYIKTPIGGPVITKKKKDIFMNARCDFENEFVLSLYNKDLQLNSSEVFYYFKTNP